MSVPLDLISLHLLVPCAVNRYEVDFELDTGSNITAISKHDADRVGIKPLKETTVVGSVKVNRAMIPISINGMPVQMVKGVIWDQANVISWTDMIVNWDVIINEKGLSMTPNMKSVGHLKRPDGSSPSVIINASINGNQTSFMLDTGANMCNLNPIDAKRLGINYNIKATLLDISINGAPVQKSWFRFQNKPNLLAWKDATVNFDIVINQNGVNLRSKTEGLIWIIGIVALLFYKDVLKLIKKKIKI